MSTSPFRALQKQVTGAFFAAAMTAAMLIGIGALATPCAGDAAMLSAAQHPTVSAAV